MNQSQPGTESLPPLAIEDTEARATIADRGRLDAVFFPEQLEGDAFAAQLAQANAAPSP